MDTNAGYNPDPKANHDAAVKRGHESDMYPTGGVFGIPIAVFLVFVTFIPIAILLFWWMMVPKPDPKANPLAVENNKGTRDEKLARIGHGSKVDQPRLEGLQQLEDGGDANTTRQPTPMGNSPEYHPEDLRYDHYQGLKTSGWVDKEKEIVHIPIQLAMEKILEKKGALPVRTKPVTPPKSDFMPTAANAGHGDGQTPPPPKGETKEAHAGH